MAVNLIAYTRASTLIIYIPARGEVNWAQEFKTQFAEPIVDHDHSSTKGARIRNAALVTNTMVANGEGVTDVNGITTAYTSADVAVSTDTIQDNAVTGTKLSSSATVDADRAVDSNHIKDNAILSRHIALDVLQDIDIAPDSIGTSELKIDAVETENITDLNVTTAKIADGNITTAKIADSNVTTSKIADANVTTAKIADSNVTTNKIADSNVTTAKIADANVTAVKIGSDVVLSTLNDVASTSPTAGQVLKWSGTEWGPGTDASAAAGTVVIGSQTDATTYSPSEGDIVVVNAVVTFTQNLTGVKLITDQAITIQNSVINRVNIHSSASVTLDSNSGPGTHPQINDCIIKANNIYIANTNKIQKCKFECYGFFFNSTYNMAGTTITTGVEDSTIICTSIFDNNTASVRVKIDRSNITTKLLQGSYNSIDSLITCYDGTTANNAADVQVNGTSYLNSVYEHPFTVNNSGIDTNVITKAKNDASVINIPTTSTALSFNTEEIDNTSSFANSTFTAKVRGFYSVSYYTRFTSIGTNHYAQAMIRKNGVTESGVRIVPEMPVNSSIAETGDMIILELDIGDTVQIFANASATGIDFGGINSHFQVNKIN